MPDQRHLLGLRAEAATAAWLDAAGWTILARRWRCPAGELDLVALDPGGSLVALEVKVRSSVRAGDPLESVGRGRVHRLRAALVQFRAAIEMPASAGLRIDLVAIRQMGDGRWRMARYAGIDAW